MFCICWLYIIDTLGVALLPGTPEKIEPIREKRKKKRDPDDEKSGKSGPPSSSGKLSRAGKMRAVSRGDHVESTKTALEKQQVRYFILQSEVFVISFKEWSYLLILENMT